MLEIRRELAQLLVPDSSLPVAQALLVAPRSEASQLVVDRRPRQRVALTAELVRSAAVTVDMRFGQA